MHQGSDRVVGRVDHGQRELAIGQSGLQLLVAGNRHGAHGLLQDASEFVRHWLVAVLRLHPVEAVADPFVDGEKQFAALGEDARDMGRTHGGRKGRDESAT